MLSTHRRGSFIERQLCVGNVEINGSDTSNIQRQASTTHLWRMRTSPRERRRVSESDADVVRLLKLRKAGTVHEGLGCTGSEEDACMKLSHQQQH